MPEPPKVVGYIGPYDPKSMKWSTYKERFAFYLQVNSITDAALNGATLLTLIGDIAYRMLADLHLPDDLYRVNFETLIADLDSAYGIKYQNWHHAYDSSLSSNTRVNQSTSISRIFVIHRSIGVSALNLIIASRISL